MAATPQIIIYASLPLKVSGTNLNLHPSNWDWVHCLSIPLNSNTLQFSQKPYKWARYAIGAVIGAEGDLFTSPDLSNIMDYNADLPVDSVTLYYHTSDEERQMMFPIDPYFFHTGLTSGMISPWSETFHSEVAERDGGACVWTRVGGIFCDAVHLVAQSKGDNYISTLTHHRGRGNENSIITEIDDIQNGIFLFCEAHRIFGTQFAFLKTPNFAMNTDDVDHTVPSGEKRFTAHIIQIDGQQMPSDFVPGSTIQISGSHQFPPDILFDTVYAGFILHNFSTASMRDRITMAWEDTFYSKSMTATHSEITDEHTTITMKKKMDQAQKYEKQEMMRAAREEAEEADVAEQRNMQERFEERMRQINLNAV